MSKMDKELAVVEQERDMFEIRASELDWLVEKMLPILNDTPDYQDWLCNADQYARCMNAYHMREREMVSDYLLATEYFLDKEKGRW